MYYYCLYYLLSLSMLYLLFIIDYLLCFSLLYLFIIHSSRASCARGQPKTALSITIREGRDVMTKRASLALLLNYRRIGDVTGASSRYQ